MCISTAPSSMSATRIYVGAATRPSDGSLVHILGYANTAATVGINAMVLPIPATQPPTQDDFFDMRGTRAAFFDRYIKKHKIRRRSLSKSFSSDDHDSLNGFEVFQSGSYTVIVARDATTVGAAVQTLPVAQRPVLSNQILSEMAKQYPGWPILVCVWKGDIQAEPIMLSYTPRDPKSLFIPMRDSHDGKTFPHNADRDHVICTGLGGGEDEEAPEGMEWVFNKLARTKDVVGKSPNTDLRVEVGTMKYSTI